MGRCSISPAANSNEVKLFQSYNGFQQLAETRRFKVAHLQYLINYQKRHWILGFLAHSAFNFLYSVVPSL